MNALSSVRIDVGRLADIPRRGARLVRLPGIDLAVFRTGADEVFALDNRCPHRGGPLAEGIVHGRFVTCPLHNWVIDLSTGEAQGADSGCVRTARVEIGPDGRLTLDLAALPLREAAL